MKEELISFDTAKLAFEKGYPIYNNIAKSGFYNRRTKTFIHFGRTGKQIRRHLYPAPTQSLLQKWLRDKHKIHIEPQYSWLLDDNKKTMDDVVWWYYIYPNYPHGGRHKTFPSEIEEPSTYEEALGKGLFEALKLIEK